MVESSGLRSTSVTKARELDLFGLELLDAMPEVSRTAQDRSSLTSMVILIWPSTIGGRPGWGWQQE